MSDFFYNLNYRLKRFCEAASDLILSILWTWFMILGAIIGIALPAFVLMWFLGWLLSNG